MNNKEVLMAIVPEPSSPISSQPPIKKPKIKANCPRAAWDHEKIVALLKLRYSQDAKKKYTHNENK